MSAVRVLSRAAVLLVLGAAVSSRAGAQSVVVGPLPSSMSAIPGASVTVPVVADLTASGGASLGSIAARLTWRPGTLAYVSTGAGALGSPTLNADSASSGILKFALANASGATGMPVLINATFNVTGAPADTTDLGLSVSEITAAGTFASLLPYTTTTGAQFCTSTGLWGDTNGDGFVMGNDALIIVTNAVGLPIAPYTVVNGDVDASGTVDTRDALIVLSDAVGIPVTQFRIGRLNSGICSLRSAASVQIEPRTPTVAMGDSLPVTATVRDSTGAPVQGVGLVWASNDTTVLRVGAAGSLVALAPGSTYARVIVQPGVKDSIPVVVTSVRHVWYVNPVVAAANGGIELGSQLYPFSTIDTAVVRAAANDTVRVAVADYGPAHIGKALVMLGDSGATGFPRLTNTTGPALGVDSVLSGAVEVRGFRLLNSASGLVSRWAYTLVLGSISVEGSRGTGIHVYATDSLLLSHSSVVGAVGKGIILDSLRVVGLDYVRSDAISQGASDVMPPQALWGQHLGTVTGDSITLGTAGAVLDSVNTLALRRIRVFGSQGPALQAYTNSASVVGGDFSGAANTTGVAPVSWSPGSYAVALVAGSGAIQLDSSKVHDNALFGLLLSGGTTISLRADTVARNYASGPADVPSAFTGGFGWLRIAQSVFLNNGLGQVNIGGNQMDSATVDSTVFDGTNVLVDYVAAFRMHGGAVRNGRLPALDVEYTPAVSLDSVEVAANSGIATYNGFAMPAVFVYSADTATANGLNAHDNGGGALGAFSSGVLRVNGGTMVNNGLGLPSLGTTRATLVASSVSDALFQGVTLQDNADAGIAVAPSGTSRTVVDSSSLAGSSTLVQESYACCSAVADTLIVSRSSLTGFGGTSSFGVDAQYLVKLSVTGNLLDSMWTNGVQTYSVDTTLVSGNTIRAWGNAGVNTNYGVLTADSNAFAGCTNAAAIHAYEPGTTSATGNTMTGCGSLVWVEGNFIGGGSAVRVLGNTVTRDTGSTTQPGIRLDYGLGYVEVAGNSIVGGVTGGIQIGSGYTVDSVRLDSNTVRYTAGNGVQVNSGPGPLSLRYNLVTDNALAGLLMYAPFVATYNTVVRNLSSGVLDYSASYTSYRLGNVVGNLPYGVATTVSSMQADSNWWGGTKGPRCAAGCDTTSALTGDSISGLVAYFPYDTAAAALAPAIPLAAPVARPLAVRAVAVPRAPKAAATDPVSGPAAGARARPRPVVPRAIRPAGRPSGRYEPVWKAGGQL